MTPVKSGPCPDYFLGARITYETFVARMIIMCHHKFNLCIVCCFSFFVLGSCLRPKVFFGFFFLLYSDGKPADTQTAGVKVSISEIHPLKTRSAHQILSGPRRWPCCWSTLILSLFLLTSVSNLELILWLHGSFQLQTMLTKKGTGGPG